jgi:integrase
MSYQRGSLKKVHRKEGETWMLRFRVRSADGRWVEGTSLPVGLVLDLPNREDALREVDKQGLLVQINCEAPSASPIRFDALAEFYLKTDYGEDAGRPKSENSIPIVEHYVRDYLIARWGNGIAENIKTLDVQRWLKSLHKDNELEWPTVDKIRGLMNRIYKIGIVHERIFKNPVENVEIPTKSNYKAILITPALTRAILGHFGKNLLHFTLLLACAATALRASELIALRWADILWEEGRIRISKRWAKGKDGDPKTPASDAYAPMHPVLGLSLREWHQQTPYRKQDDFVFPSLKSFGKVPLSASVFVADYLRPAALAVGVRIPKGGRFGFHNLRHSLSNWLVNKRKENPKTVQGILRHARIQTTLDLYAESDLEEMQNAQGAFLSEMGMRTAVIQ